MNGTLVVIPTYNEKENVLDVSQAVLTALPEAHILFVDDNSPDGTGQIADEMSAKDPRIHCLHRQDKQGLGRAYVAGFKWALTHHYEFIFEMDADFSHNPADLPRILSVAQTADLALGSRYVGGIRIINWPLSRLILSKGAAVYVRRITGMPFTDPTGGFKCYRRAVLESIDLDRIKSNGYSFQIEMTNEAWIRGFHIVEAPITFEERRSGQSKMSSNIVREALWMVWKLLFHNRLKRTASNIRNPRSVLAAEITP
jgi:dolichol-phosphate mannosyltransferase